MTSCVWIPSLEMNPREEYIRLADILRRWYFIHLKRNSTEKTKSVLELSKSLSLLKNHSFFSCLNLGVRAFLPLLNRIASLTNE